MPEAMRSSDHQGMKIGRKIKKGGNDPPSISGLKSAVVMMLLFVVMSDMVMVLCIMVMLWIATMMAAIVLAVMVATMTCMSLFHVLLGMCCRSCGCCWCTCCRSCGCSCICCEGNWRCGEGNSSHKRKRYEQGRDLSDQHLGSFGVRP